MTRVKTPIITAVDIVLKYFFLLFFRENKMTYQVNHLVVKTYFHRKINFKMWSAAVVIGALRDNGH